MTARFALIGEARGEFLALEMIADRMRESLGPEGVVHVQMDPADLTAEELARTVVPATWAEFREAMGIPVGELPAEIAAAEERYRVPSLRRLWQSDLQFWRDGRPEHELARQAIGYMRVFDKLYDLHPELAGGYAEDSTRLIKRAFRAVSEHRGRRMVVALFFAYPGRVALVDQETLSHTNVSWNDYVPTGEELALAADFLERVRTSTLQFAEPRNLALTPRRLKNFASLTWRTYAGKQPGDRNPHLLRYAARDYVAQRVRLAVLRRVAVRQPQPERAVFYPFHYATDSQVAIRGEAYRDQLAAVRLIAGSLPYGYRLWVKPHPAFAGQVPLGGIRDLRRLGNVDVIHPSVHAQELLRRVSALVTINSTTGFEALALRVPVVTLGASLYARRGVTMDVDDPSDLAAVLRAAVHGPPAADESVERLMAYLIHVSRDMPMLEGNHDGATTKLYAEALLDEFALNVRQADEQAV